MSHSLSPQISLSSFQRENLEQIVRKRTNPQQLVIRAKIILLADQGVGIRKMARQLGVSRDMVQRWQRRWLENETEVIVKRRLADAPRSGTPATYTAEQICAIIAIACERPEDNELPFSHWTQQEIADEAVKRGIVTNISRRSIGRFLNEADLQPHRVRVWLTPKSDEKFPEKCADICDTYQKAPEREKSGEKSISVDEMTGVQALERAAPCQPMKAGQPEHQEFEYIRHDTQTLIAGLNVATGQIFGEIGDTRTENDFTSFISHLLATENTSTNWHIIVDNLNTHVSESLVRLVAKESDINDGGQR